MILIPESLSKSNSAAPRLVRTERSNERPPPIITLPPPMPSSTSRRSSSERSRSNLSSERLDEKRPVGLSDWFESAHLMTYVAAFALDTLPRQLYLHFLFRLPYIYFSRMVRIFEEADIDLLEIKQTILEEAIQLKAVKDVADARKLEPVESAQHKLQNTWKTFVESFIRDWKTLNIVSVLLLS